MRFADTVRGQIEAKGWSIKQFADEIGRSPEHARKISTGLAFPSGDLTARIAEKLGIDQTELQKQLQTDRWEKKYKRKPPESERPDFGSLEDIWNDLSGDQRQVIICLANCLKNLRGA